MKKIGISVSIVFIILSLMLSPLSFADSSGTLAAPGDFTARIEDNYILITVEGAGTGQYTAIERSTDSGDFKVITALGPGITSFKDYSVSNGHVYKYRARRRSDKSSSPYTQEIEIIYLYPQYLSITGVYSDQINLEWSYPQLLVPRTVTYETVIERKAEGKSGWTVIDTVPFYQTQFRDHRLDPDTVYYYRIRTRYAENQYSRYIPSTSGVYRRTKIDLATPLTGFAVTERKIRLDWDREALGDYTVYLQRLDSFGEYETIYSSSEADHYIDSSDEITPGEEYTYRLYVRSSKDSVSAYSESVTIKAETIPAPSQLAAKPGPYGRINLTWEYPYDVESGFEIWRKEEGRTWQKVDEVGRNTYTWTDYSALTDTKYRYRIRAVRGENVFSDFAVSNQVNNAEPSEPGRLYFLSLGSYMLIGTDDSIPEGVTYTLEFRKDINDEWTEYTLGQREGNLLVYFFPASGTAYDFRIRSNNQGNITYGPVYHLPASVPDAPQNLRVAYMGSNRVLLSWNDMATTEEGYFVYRTINGKRTLIARLDKDTTNFADTGVTPGINVHYEVSSFNARGESGAASIDVSVPQKAAFRDLGGYEWCRDAVNALAASGVISQNSEGLFRPSADITRAEFVTMLLKSYGIVPESDFLFTVKDVPRNSWYYPYMMTAVKLGIIIPDSEGRTYPSATVTRENMAVLLSRFLASQNRKLGTVSVSYLDRFTDGYLVRDDVKGIVSSLAADGILPPQGGLTLDIGKKVTRAEAAVVLYRFSAKYD